jgi:preprotein translocase subunit YajC
MIDPISAAGLLSMQAGSPDQPAANPIIGFLVPMGLILIIFYFLLIRPANKKQKAIQAMLSNLKNGDKVITTGGIHGVVSGMKDEIVHLKIADGVKIEISRNAIAALAGNPEE